MAEMVWEFKMSPEERPPRSQSESWKPSLVSPHQNIGAGRAFSRMTEDEKSLPVVYGRPWTKAMAIHWARPCGKS